MLCTIIIPLYNKADFIAETLQSIFNQTYQHFEIIVVDDGSKDDGVEQVQGIQDKRITLVQQRNGGVSKARNHGINLAKGDLVCFLDADDWYQPQYLETIVSMAKRYDNIPCFATRHKLVTLSRGDSKFWPVTINQHFEIIDNLFHRWRFGILFHMDSFAVRRDFLLSFQPCFPIGEQMGEDQDLFFRLAEKSPIVYCSTQLTAYRLEVSESLCAIYQGNALFPAYQRLEQRALNRQMPNNLRYSALRLASEARITAARSTLMAGQRYQGFKQLLVAWRGMISKRWWVSLAMCVLASPSMVRHWEYWRNQKLHRV